jgi:Tfp pilus assembly protein PilV
MKNPKSKILNPKSGFTIVETLVAIAILVGVIIGSIGAVQTGLSSYIYSKNQIMAFYLAQEGFEQVRNIRDENALNGRNWLSGIAANSSDPCYFGNTCTVDVTNSTHLARCSAGAGFCPVFNQDPVTGFFGYNNAWPTTVFRREVVLSSVNEDEIAITVTVDWSKGSVSRQFKARENILNWQ